MRTESFQVRLPPTEYNLLEELNVSTFAVKFEGTGEEANATFDFVDPLWSLNIFQQGRGYASEPVVQLVHPVDGDIFLSLAPEWIEEAAGTDYNQTAKLLDNEKRWIRGIRVKPNSPLVKPFSFFSGFDLMDYYLSYRTDFSEHGIALNIATDPESSQGVLEPFLLDTTPQTPQDFTDAALLIGSTYSDYDSDLHFTPVKVGGVDPMTYIEVAIHSGTIEDNLAEVPDFELVSSETNPALGEQVRFSIVSDNDTKNYAYSWFLNEQALDDPFYLNQSSILLNFTKTGNQVLRVLVSDMMGAVASRNLLIEVGDNHLTNLSSISGSVLSMQSAVQGARVILEKAAVIEHNVSITGNLRDSFYSISTGNSAKFLIDGEAAPELNFRRGEIHRFNFHAIC